MLLHQLVDAARVLQRVVVVRRLALLERAAVGAVGRLSGGGADLALPRRRRHLHVLVLPGLGVVGARLGIPAREEPVEILGVAEGAPLLSIDRVAIDQDGVPFETAHDLFRADRTRLTVRTRGQAGTTSSAVASGKVVELKARAY
jgi:hypothetical protein